MSRILGLGIGVTLDLRVGFKTTSRERLSAIMLTGYEEELHSQAGCARRRRGVSAQHRSFRRAAAELKRVILGRNASWFNARGSDATRARDRNTANGLCSVSLDQTTRCARFPYHPCLWPRRSLAC